MVRYGREMHCYAERVRQIDGKIPPPADVQRAVDLIEQELPQPVSGTVMSALKRE
jgi:hypothetical protein